jgi:hypothetical protein
MLSDRSSFGDHILIIIVFLFSIQCNKTEKENTQIYTNTFIEQPINNNSNNQANRFYTGIVNDNAVCVRELPYIERIISGQLNHGLTVTVLGRSEKRMFLDGYDSY